MKNFIAHTEDSRQELLKSISCASLEDLFSQIPVKFESFDLGNPLSEMETQKKIKALAHRNNCEYITFMGGQLSIRACG